MNSTKNSFSLSKNSKNIVYLDYLRILSCIGVFACHVWPGGILTPLNDRFQNFQELSSACLGVRAEALYQCGLQSIFLLPGTHWENVLFNSFNILFGLGYQAVHIFFFLSGFGLTLSALSSEQKKEKVKWLNFLKKRFLRLYPSYWIVLIIYFVFNFLYNYIFYHYFYYKSVDSALGRFAQGAIFLKVIIPATWFVPVITQFYLLFPLLYYFLKKYSIKRFLIGSLLVKVLSSAVIVTWSVLSFDKVVGFALALAPGGLALTRLFEFSLGMALAKYYFNRGCSISVFTYFCKPSAIVLGLFLDGLGVFLSLKYTSIRFNDHSIPVGLFISDALIGVGIVLLTLNFVFLFQRVFLRINPSLLLKIGGGTYEAYLLHGCFLNFFNTTLAKPITVKLFSLTNSYFLICILVRIQVEEGIKDKTEGSTKAWRKNSTADLP